MIDRFERFSYAILEISRHWHKITADEMEKYGLKGSHSIYLLTMYRYPDGITAPQLCELCGKDKSDVSRMMSIMEQKGLVKKEGIHQNLYRGTFKLTEEGMAAAQYVRQRASLAVEIAGKQLTDEKRAVFYEALEQIASNLRSISKEGLPPYKNPNKEN
ncbi:MAG: MarR family transcriptional regulator [Lachnospiraceae bacterium]|nr:MarR family transcriptional regulator [Lachnospiraceae bacterium]